MAKFTTEFVIGITIKHMRAAVDLSIKKTSDRLEELKDTHAAETLYTLTTLNALSAMLDAFEAKYLK